MQPDFQPTDVPFWTVTQAARHFGFERQTIEKYIRMGLPTYFEGRFVKPSEVIAMKLERSKRQRNTRMPQSRAEA